MKKLENYESLFINRGYYPLEAIQDTKCKIKCIDKEGYMYFASYDMLRDKRTAFLDKWKKQNIYKPYNMRLYASKVQKNCCILSSDEDLRNSTKVKIRFKCPECGNQYEKKWCHWIAQPDNCHFCQSCLKKESTYSRQVKRWLEENKLNYTTEFWFEDCRDIRVLPFDFYIEYNGKIFLIEVDGAQHYYQSQFFKNLTLKERQSKDSTKTEYCKQKGYTLLRIPYWDFNRDTYIKKLNKTFFGQSDDLP